MTVALSVNIDHVATVRQARGTRYPDPVRAAVVCELAGAHGITIHLREDRRHAQDRDVEVLRSVCTTRLNLEMAATDEMLAIAERVRPDIVTLVPERREERTTEGGLEITDEVSKAVTRLHRSGLEVSLFIDPSESVVSRAAELGVAAIELHTGDYAHGTTDRIKELERLNNAATLAKRQNPELLVAAGHGLTKDNVGQLVAFVKDIEELNIGHALVSDALFVGLPKAVAGFLVAMQLGEQGRRAR